MTALYFQRGDAFALRRASGQAFHFNKFLVFMFRTDPDVGGCGGTYIISPCINKVANLFFS